MPELKDNRKPKEERAPYPQQPPLDNKEMEKFLEQAPIAVICTYNEDGTIHAAPVWFTYEYGEILFGTQEISRKIRNLQRNRQVTILTDTHDQPYKGVLIYGVVEFDYDDMIDKRVTIFEKYTPLGKMLRNGWIIMHANLNQ